MPGILMLLSALDLSGQYLDSMYTLFRHDSRGDILAYDGTELIIIGAARDTTTFNVGIGYTRISLDGIISVSTYLFDGHMYLLGLINDVILSDSIAYIVPLKDPSPTQIIKYNKNNGQIIERIELKNIKYDNPVVITQGMDVIDGDRFIMASVIWGGMYNETQITIVDMTNDSMRHFHNSYPGYNQNIYFIDWRGNEIYLVGDILRGDPTSPNFDKRLSIAVLDTLGNVLWRYVSPGMSGLVSDCFIEENGDIVVAHSFYEMYNYTTWWVPTCRPGISKISENGKVIWGRPLGRDYYNDDGFDNRIKAMLPSTDGDGYIVAGAQSNFSIEDYWAEPFVDTISTGEYMQDDALIAKVSKDGEVIWTRTYSKVDGLFSNDLFSDMIYHPEGGYILSGDVTEYIPGEPLVRTWLLYVDEYGCAVPGCQTVGTSDVEDDIAPILVYPNPASSELYIYQADHSKQLYTITDMGGNIIERFAGSSGGHTFILDISGYLAGSYVITRTDEYGHMVSVPWIKT